MLYVYFCAWHAKTAARDGDSLSLHEAQCRAGTDAAATGGCCLLRSCCSDAAAGEDFAGGAVAGAGGALRRVVQELNDIAI